MVTGTGICNVSAGARLCVGEVVVRGPVREALQGM